jgi:protein-tyrosine phosphatase
MTTGVLVHCEGGRGRTGTIIGLILRHFGYDPVYIEGLLNASCGEIGKPGWPESPWQASVIARVQPLP